MLENGIKSILACRLSTLACSKKEVKFPKRFSSYKKLLKPSRNSVWNLQNFTQELATMREGKRPQIKPKSTSCSKQILRTRTSLIVWLLQMQDCSQNDLKRLLRYLKKDYAINLVVKKPDANSPISDLRCIRNLYARVRMENTL